MDYLDYMADADADEADAEMAELAAAEDAAAAAAAALVASGHSGAHGARHSLIANPVVAAPAANYYAAAPIGPPPSYSAAIRDRAASAASAAAASSMGQVWQRRPRRCTRPPAAAATASAGAATDSPAPVAPLPPATSAISAGTATTSATESSPEDVARRERTGISTRDINRVINEVLNQGELVKSGSVSYQILKSAKISNYLDRKNERSFSQNRVVLFGNCATTTLIQEEDSGRRLRRGRPVDQEKRRSRSRSVCCCCCCCCSWRRWPHHLGRARVTSSGGDRAQKQGAQSGGCPKAGAGRPGHCGTLFAVA